MDNNFGYDIDLSDTISEQTEEESRPEKDLNTAGKVITVGTVIMQHQLHQWWKADI